MYIPDIFNGKARNVPSPQFPFQKYVRSTLLRIVPPPASLKAEPAPLTNHVLVTDASQRKSVPIIRSLGKNGVYVVAGEDKPLSMGFYSRFVKKRLKYPPPENHRQFADWLIDTARAGVFDIVFPIDERTMEPVTRYKEELEKYMVVPVVDHDTFMLARNKANTMEYAQKLGIPVPRTVVCTREEDLTEVLKLMPVPAVIKARESSGSRGLCYVSDRSRIFSEYKRIHAQHPFPLIQELIPPGGSTYGVEGLCDHGKVLRLIVHRRIREYPIKGGPSTLRESIYKPDILEHAVKLLMSLKWHGVVMLEFKEDPRNGQCVLLEINPKFWGSIALPIAAGVDFPYLLYRLACRGEISEEYSYPEHVLCRWLLPGDLLHFIFNPDRFNLKPSFFDFRNTSYDIFDTKDLGPLLLLMITLARDLFLRRTWTDKIMRR
ncbi:MAG TPA: ATP-grasp domain-containing protein [Desulfomonilia bacterium]|jgi:predicted ATP-grasp superfamily ATP-dependent carboligase|nr:ATP-grasp domain-containing protein [Desulfomonilia bacterium]HRT45550.1 ATP-grasp domain-containing protein [Desulfomonilia bacterium]